MMEAIQTKVKIYVTRDGKVPFVNWLEKLRDMKGKQIIRT
jgi:putative component of toxin-antitoxin plasmid stabilization module